jgi:hypothetical protein
VKKAYVPVPLLGEYERKMAVITNPSARGKRPHGLPAITALVFTLSVRK